MRAPFRVIIAVLCSIARTGSALADCTLPSTPNDGYFDQTWTGHGCVVFNGDNTYAMATSAVDKIMPLAGGTLLLGGEASGLTAGYWWVGELDSGGNFVTTFGDADNSGRINECTLLTCGSDSSYDYAMQADGKVLVLSAQHLARTGVGAHGLDTTGVSGNTGYVPPSYIIGSPSAQMYASNFGAVAATSGGGVFTAGFGYPSGAAYADFGIARLIANLTVDATFHAVTEGGIIYAGGNFIDLGNAAEASQIFELADGHIVLAGYSGYRDILVARLNSNGELDTTYNAAGSRPGTILISSGSLPNSIVAEASLVHPAAVDRVGRVVYIVDGYTVAHGYLGALVTRFNADGTQDMSFGTSGWSYNDVFPACPISGFQPNAVTIDEAGRILVAGMCDSEFGVIRLRGDTVHPGGLDTSWGIGGMAHGKFSPTSTGETESSIAFDGAGHFHIGGSTHPTGSATQSAVARLTYDLIHVGDFESAPRGCLPPNCN